MKNVRIVGLAGFLPFVMLVSCNVNVGVGPGGVGVSFTLLGKTLAFSFGDAGLINAVANQTVTQPAALRLFEDTPSEVPSTGQMRLPSSSIGVAQPLSSKLRLMAAAPPQGIATIRFLIAAGTSA